MHKVFSIVGPTAAGKTNFALGLSKILLNSGKDAVHLISADSKQVYQGLESLTGADVPPGFVLQNHPDYLFPVYEKDGVAIHGISILSPELEWSVSQFQELALPIIKKAGLSNQAVIVIGGTGLYHDHLFSTDFKLKIPPNQEIRNQAQSLSIDDLQSWLSEINPSKYDSMNNSDRSNPRRLIRAIEIAVYEGNNPMEQLSDTRESEFDHLYLGVDADLPALKEKILARVNDRFGEALLEVERLTANNTKLSKTARSSIGLKQLQAYLSDQLQKDEVVDAWSRREFQYAKRQLTWWRKRSEIEWLSPEQLGDNDFLQKLAKNLLKQELK